MGHMSWCQVISRQTVKTTTGEEKCPEGLQGSGAVLVQWYSRYLPVGILGLNPQTFLLLKSSGQNAELLHRPGGSYQLSL